MDSELSSHGDLSAGPALRPAVFLDRDGTLNVDRYSTYRPDQLEVIAGVKEGLLLLKKWGFDLVIISNQGGIGRGAYTEAEMWRFNDLLMDALRPVALERRDFYFCPHDPQRQSCACSKPQPGLLLSAAQARGIDLAGSFMIGDKLSDMLAGQRAGCQTTILVKTGITDDRGKYDFEPAYVLENLLEAARMIGKIAGLPE